MALPPGAPEEDRDDLGLAPSLRGSEEDLGTRRPPLDPDRDLLLALRRRRGDVEILVDRVKVGEREPAAGEPRSSSRGRRSYPSSSETSAEDDGRLGRFLNAETPAELRIAQVSLEVDRVPGDHRDVERDPLRERREGALLGVGPAGLARLEGLQQLGRVEARDVDDVVEPDLAGDGGRGPLSFRREVGSRLHLEVLSRLELEIPGAEREVDAAEPSLRERGCARDGDAAASDSGRDPVGTDLARRQAHLPGQLLDRRGEVRAVEERVLHREGSCRDRPCDGPGNVEARRETPGGAVELVDERQEDREVEGRGDREAAARVAREGEAPGCLQLEARPGEPERADLDVGVVDDDAHRRVGVDAPLRVRRLEGVEGDLDLHAAEVGHGPTGADASRRLCRNVRGEPGGLEEGGEVERVERRGGVEGASARDGARRLQAETPVEGVTLGGEGVPRENGVDACAFDAIGTPREAREGDRAWTVLSSPGFSVASSDARALS